MHGPEERPALEDRHARAPAREADRRGEAAKPAPTTTTWRGVIPQASRRSSGAAAPTRRREPRLLRPREPYLRPEDVVVAEHDAAQELLVDEAHRLGRREGLAVLLGEEEPRSPVVLAGAARTRNAITLRKASVQWPTSTSSSRQPKRRRSARGR